ncbi:hypothetical protein GCM10023205_24450 [Yinghuangia aomiensis]|uniref:Pyrrolo-quinoline quinone repeat domain-containing protein n=1 Tax=Yinghuangia aomiensis TaxID=676205 RepID=A0ABP9H5G4_9ACTN
MSQPPNGPYGPPGNPPPGPPGPPDNTPPWQAMTHAGGPSAAVPPQSKPPTTPPAGPTPAAVPPGAEPGLSLPGVPPPPGTPSPAGPPGPAAAAYPGSTPAPATPPYSYGTSSTPPPQRTPGRGLIAGLSTITALAVIAAGALGYLYATKDDGGTGPGGGLATDGKTMRQAWKSPAPGARIDMLGTWTAPGRTIAGDKTALVAYDAGTGAEIGRFTPPTGEFCGMAAHGSDGVGLAMYGPKDACDTTVAVDLATMRSLWDKKTKTAATGDKYRSVETDSGPGTAVLSTSTGVAAFGLKDGVQKWSWNFDRSSTSTTDDPEVDALRIDGGTVLVELGQYTKNTPAQVVALDAADGRRKWQTTIPVTDSGYSTVYLVNAEPAVVEIQRNGSYYLQSLGDQGQLRAEIPLRGPDGTLRAYDTRSAAYSSDFGAAPQYGVVITKDTLFATAVKRDQPAGQAVRLVAFDLASGKARWSTALGGDLYNADVVGTDDTAVFVLGRGLPGTPGKLVSVKRQDGTVRGARAVDGKDFLTADERAGWSLADQRLTAFAWTAYPEVPALVTLA